LVTIRPGASVNYPIMGRRATVDAELCIGSTECNLVAPRAFRLDEELGVSVALPAVAETPDELLVRAAQACPTQAIRLVRDDGVVVRLMG
jgi:ferredoxin